MAGRTRLHTQSRPEQVSFALFVLTLFFAPLAFGTTEAWSMTTIELLVAATGMLFFFPLTQKAPTLYTTPGLLPLLLLLLWMYMQCIPLPPQLVRFIAPRIFDVYQPLLDINQTTRWIPLTVNQKATLLECLRISSYTLFYVLAVQLLSRNSSLRKTAQAVSVLALVIAFLAFLQKCTSPHKIYWIREVTANPWGPWVYPNHYAGFMVMVCPLVLALFFYYRPNVQYRESFREKFVSMFSMPGSNIHLFLGFGTILILTSIVLSLSRGGILSVSFAMALFFAILARRQSGTNKIIPLLLLCCLILSVAWFNWEPVFEKFSYAFTDPEGAIREGRLLIWQDSLKIIHDFPVTGSGFGTFVDIFPSYKSFMDICIYEHAHNDYIELFTDGGLIGFTLAAWFVIKILTTGLKQIFARRDSFAVLLATGAFSGIAGILLYSVTDFNLHNGANGLYFFFLCGLLVSAGHTRQHYRTHPSLLARIPSSIAGNAAFVAVNIFLILILLVQGGTFTADKLYSKANNIAASMQRREKKITGITVLLEQATQYDPLAGRYSYAIANLEKYRYQDEKALENYIDAAMKQPMEGAFLQAAGLLLARVAPDKAQVLLENGYRRAKQKNVPLRVWVEFLLKHDKRAEAVHILRDKLQQHPELLDTIYPLLLKYSFKRQEVVTILPELTSSWLKYGNLSRNSGNMDDSGYFLEHALDFLDQEPTVTPQFFMQVYNYYHNRKEEEKAITTLRQGIKRLPNYAPFHIRLGDYYQKKGISYRAREEYEQALFIEPANNDTKRRIKQLQKEEKQ